MRKVVLWSSVSLDGYIEGPEAEIDWHMVDDELHTYFNDQLGRAGGFLEGRVTYELMEEFWPTADQDPENEGPVAEFAAIWRDMPKIVYSRTLEEAGWGTTIVRDVVPEEVMAMKAVGGGDLIVGGGDLGSRFIELGLIDEYSIFVHPVLIGAGKPLFPESVEQTQLQHVDTRTFGNGVVHNRYRRQ